MYRPRSPAAVFSCAVALLAVLAAPSPFSARQQRSGEEDNSLAGAWEGVLGEGAAQLHLVLTLAKKSDGAYSGNLNSLDQHAVIPVESATLHGDAVHFEVHTVGGVYEGIFIRNDEIRGTWTQAGVPPQPLSFKLKPASRAPEPRATGPRTPRPISAPLDVIPSLTPWAFQAAGKWHLAYELHVTNLGRSDCALTRLEVVSADSAAAPSKPLADFSATDLVTMVAHPGLDDAGAKIAPGTFAIIYIWLDFDRPDDIPLALVHRISMKIGDYPEGLRLDAQPLTVLRGPLPELDPPLRGDSWMAVNGPSNSSIHRRALIPVNGRGSIAQRFAIDWLQLFSDGVSHHGDPADNKNYRCYGAEVYAVADGVVTEMKDGIPQNVPGLNSRAVPITLETVAGNHIIIEIAGGAYAFYAHLQPGSLRVHLGDHIKRGQVLGLVGNSGNSTEPHLHFHLCNANSPLACEGLPYSLSWFEVRPAGAQQSPSPPVPHKHELPLQNMLVNFPP
jgi:murein DD-endopeptidase